MCNGRWVRDSDTQTIQGTLSTNAFMHTFVCVCFGPVLPKINAISFWHLKYAAEIFSLAARLLFRSSPHSTGPSHFPVLVCSHSPSTRLFRRSPFAYKIRKCGKFSWNNWISYAWKTLENQFLIPLERSNIKSDIPFRSCDLCSVNGSFLLCFLYLIFPSHRWPVALLLSHRHEIDWSNVCGTRKKAHTQNRTTQRWVCQLTIFGILNISSMVNMSNASNKNIVSHSLYFSVNHPAVTPDFFLCHRRCCLYFCVQLRSFGVARRSLASISSWFEIVILAHEFPIFIIL